MFLRNIFGEKKVEIREICPEYLYYSQITRQNKVLYVELYHMGQAPTHVYDLFLLLPCKHLLDIRGSGGHKYTPFPCDQNELNDKDF